MFFPPCLLYLHRCAYVTLLYIILSYVHNFLCVHTVQSLFNFCPEWKRTWELSLLSSVYLPASFLIISAIILLYSLIFLCAECPMSVSICDEPEEPYEISHRRGVLCVHAGQSFFSVLKFWRNISDSRFPLTCCLLNIVPCYMLYWYCSAPLCIFNHSLSYCSTVSSVYVCIFSHAFICIYCHVNLLTMYFPIIKS